MANGHPPILAVDFDGTIKKSKDFNTYTGGLQTGCYDVLNKLKQQGCRLILWTCRAEGEAMDKAKGFLIWYGLLDLFERFNENIPELGFPTSPKIYADYYIDDLNVGGFIGWDKVYEIVMRDSYFHQSDSRLAE